MIDYTAAAETFDFAYLTDVIHHIPDLPAMFRELRRVLKQRGALCVLTESHAQIEGRFYNRYFPSLAESEKCRYPGIGQIAAAAREAGLSMVATEVLPSPARQGSEAFLRNVAEKNWSMYRLLPHQEFCEGLEALAGDLGRTFESPQAGETLLWFRPAAPVPLPGG